MVCMYFCAIIMIMDLHNGTVCGSSSSAERYSVEELEEEQSETNSNKIMRITYIKARQLSIRCPQWLHVSNKLWKFASNPFHTILVP